MSKVIVHQAEGGKAAVPNPFFAKVEEALEAVRRRAYQLFEARGRAAGGELEDWLQAEKDLFFVPKAEVAETGKGFTMKIAAPGFDARDIEVIALPREVLVEAKAEKRMETGHAGSRESSIESKSLYRRFDFTLPIDADKVTAHIDKGQLTIEAPKKVLKPIAVRAAAA